MKSKQMEHLKKILEKHRVQIDKTIRSMKANREADQDVDSPGELSNYDNHPAELGTEVYSVQMNNTLMVHEEHLLKEIHDAFGRMENGSYGKCEFCGKEIANERLEIIPYARLCIACEESKKVDTGFLHSQRPVEELIWDAPLGRKYLNRREDDEFEGLDYFNDVMKYGSSDTPQDLGGYHDYSEFYTNEIDLQGIVDRMDGISNEEYKRQLPD